MADFGAAIVAFARDGQFPTPEECDMPLTPEALAPAISALKDAKKSLETEIHAINDDTKDDVGSWVRNAKSLQEDVLKSKSMANAIMRDSEDPGQTGRAVEESEEKARFLTLEVQYAQQLHSVLRAIKRAHALLDQVEQKKEHGEMEVALKLLDESTEAIQQIPVNWLCRPKRLLETRAQELRAAIHEALGLEWKELVSSDVDNNSFTVRQSIDGEQRTLHDAIRGLKYFKEVDECAEQLWHGLDAAVVTPRLEVDQWSFSAVQIQEDTLLLSGETDNTVAAVLADLGKVFTFLHQSLPSDLLDLVCAKAMPDLTHKLITTWLDPAVPPSVKQIDEFDEVIHHTKVFCEILSTNGLTGFESLINWVANAPSVWLAKCRETTLATMRDRLTKGTQSTKVVERIHKEIIAVPAPEPVVEEEPVADPWNDGWGDDEPEQSKATENSAETPAEDDGADAWGWDDDGDGDADDTEPDITKEDLDDAADAWGWGNEEEEEPVKPKPVKTEAKAITTKEKLVPIKKAAVLEKREIVTRERCSVSGISDAVLDSVRAILEDGVLVSGFGEENIVASAAAGMFAIPKLILGLFRGISPYYYALEAGGNMYLYNDAMYMAEQLDDVTQKWKARSDVNQQVKSLLRLDSEVKSLQAFADRAYNNELSTQKTVVRDMMGGAYSVVQQGEDGAEAAIERVQMVALEWETLLTRSLWCKSVGALIETIASKVIADIMDLPSIGQEEGYQMAAMISKISSLDKLFLPSRLHGTPVGGDEISVIASHVSSWLRMQFLSEVLQSNLNEVKFLWCESDLSLYFTADEVVDLIGASFEMNARAKEVVREIRQKPARLA